MTDSQHVHDDDQRQDHPQGDQHHAEGGGAASGNITADTMHENPDTGEAGLPTAPTGASGEDVMDILASVEQQFGRLREAKKQQDQQLASLAERSQALQEAERELEAELDRVCALEQQVEQDRAALDEQRASLDEQKRHVEAQSKQAHADAQEVERQRAELAESQRALADQRAELEEQAASLAEQRTEFEQQMQARQAELNEQKQSIAEQRESLDRDRSVLESLDAELGERRESIEQQQATFNDREQQIAERESALAEQESAWNEEKQSQEAQLAERQNELDDREMQLLESQEQFEARQKQVDELAARVEQDQQIIEQRSRELDEQIAHWQQKVEQAEARMAEADQSGSQLRDALSAAQQQLEKSYEEAESLRSKCDELVGELERARAEAGEAGERLAECSRVHASELDEIRQQHQVALQKQSAAHEQACLERDAAQSRCEEAEEKLQAMRTRVEELEQNLAASERELADAREKLSVAGAKLKEFSRALAEQTPQLERGAAAIATVEQQNQQIEKLNRELAEAKRSGNPQELRSRDERIMQLTEALRQARGQKTGGADSGALQAEIAELSRQCDELRIAHDQMQLEKQQAVEQLESSRDAAARAGSLEEKLAEAEKQLAELTAQLHRAEQRANEAESNATTAAANNRDGKADEQMQQRIRVVAEHLQRRRNRLANMRRAIRSRAAQQAASLESAKAGGSGRMSVEQRDQLARQMREIENQRQELIEVRNMLSASERAMIRKWARPRAVATSGWLLFMVSLVCVASWFGVLQYAPPQAVATVTFQPDAAELRNMDEAELSAWKDWHAELIWHDSFQTSLANRCRDRKIVPYGNRTELVDRLADDLTLDMSAPDALSATLVGTDADSTALLLDVLATNLTLESNRQLGKRSDNAAAVALGERKEDGRVCFATVHQESPYTAERLQLFGMVAGAAVGLVLLLIIGIYSKLAKAKRVFDENQFAIDDAVEGVDLTSDEALLPMQAR